MQGAGGHTFEDHVDLNVFVRLLAGLGCDQDVDANLDARRLVDDLVTAGAGGEASLDGAAPETDALRSRSLVHGLAAFIEQPIVLGAEEVRRAIVRGRDAVAEPTRARTSH